MSAASKTVWSGCILLCVILPLQPVLAQSNAQGLTWGFAAGDEFQYVWTVYDNWSMYPAVFNWSERIRVEIESLPTIPTYANSLQDLFYMLSDFGQAYFANGTAATRDFPWTALPIGNWPLMAELLLESLRSSVGDNASVSLTWTTCIAEYDVPSGWGYSGSWTMEFLLSDGVLMHFYHQTVVNTYSEEELVTTIEVVRLLPSGAPVLVTAILGAAMIATILVIEVHRRRKTPTG